MPKNKDWRISKNVIDLQYKKLLQEYNAILVALFSVTVGIIGVTYTTTKDVPLTLIGGVISIIILNFYRENKSKQINWKIREAKELEW